MRLFLREANDCKPGTQWWVCNVPQYRGCCSVDACHRGGCPDVSIEPSTTITASIQQPTGTSSPILPVITASFTSVSSPFPTTGSSTSVSAANPGQATSAPSTAVNAAGTTLAVEPRVTDTTLAGSSSSSSKTPIIAGSVAGAVGLAIMAVLIWFCVRRRRSSRPSTSDSSAYLEKPKKAKKSKSPDLRTEVRAPSFAEDRVDGPSSDTETVVEDRGLNSDDVFAPFGGYHRSRSMQERAVSAGSTSSQQTIIINRAARPVSQVEDDEDEPLPDFEKSSISAPPLFDHPALHPLPGQSPEVPTYHPGQEIVSPEMAQHPTYLAKHPSLVNKHPILRNVESTRGNLQSHPKSHLTFPFSRPEVSSSKDLTANETEQTDSLSTLPIQRGKQTNRISRTFLRRSYTPIASLQQESILKPTRKTKSFDTSPIPGRSELPAIVPQELSSTPAKSDSGRVDLFRRAAEKRIDSPIGLGVASAKGPCDFPRKPIMMHESPVSAMKPEMVQVSTSTGSPSRKRRSRQPVKKDDSVKSPEYHVSPNLDDSPALQSSYYQSHVVSPDLPIPTDQEGGQFVAFGHSFDRKPHVSQMQIPVSSRSPPRSYTPPLKSQNPVSLFSSSNSPRRAASPPQRPRIDTSMTTPGLSKKHKDSLGKGNEDVMSWATYHNHTSPAPSQAQPSIRHNAPPLRSFLRPTGAMTQGNQEGEQSPLLKRSPEERWSGSTVALEGSPIERGVVDGNGSGVSPSVYSQDADGNRYSFVVGNGEMSAFGQSGNALGNELPELPLGARDNHAT